MQKVVVVGKSLDDRKREYRENVLSKLREVFPTYNQALPKVHDLIHNILIEAKNYPTK